jgi:hypothetical protein
MPLKSVYDKETGLSSASGNITQIGMILFVSNRPRWPRQVGPRHSVFPLAKVSAITPAITPATATRIELALTTLGDATQTGSFQLAKASKQGMITPAISC